MIKNNNPTGINTAVTGQWGAGVFGHHILVSAGIQYLAGKAAGIDKMTFTGISPSQEKQVKGVMAKIDSMTVGKTHVNLQQVLKEFLAYAQASNFKMNS